MNNNQDDLGLATGVQDIKTFYLGAPTLSLSLSLSLRHTHTHTHNFALSKYHCSSINFYILIFNTLSWM
jgi:hypothetical protein